MHRITGAAGALTAVAAISALTAADGGDRPGAVGEKSACAALSASIVPLAGAASGTTFADLVVVNHGTKTCTLAAQPTLEYFDANHKHLPVTFSSDPSLKPFDLAPGAAATMAVGYGSDGNPPCDTTIASVRVTPPGADLPYAGALHCANDITYEQGWVAGIYVAPH